MVRCQSVSIDVCLQCVYSEFEIMQLTYGPIVIAIFLSLFTIQYHHYYPHYCHLHRSYTMHSHGLYTLTDPPPWSTHAPRSLSEEQQP